MTFPGVHILSAIDQCSRKAMCKKCGSVSITRIGQTKSGKTKWRCEHKTTELIQNRKKQPYCELKSRLEAKFECGMTWNNWGEWHIDHIEPLSSFDLTDREQFLRATHFSNLQPLWKLENLRKGAGSTK